MGNKITETSKFVLEDAADASLRNLRRSVIEFQIMNILEFRISNLKFTEVPSGQNYPSVILPCR